MELTAFRVILAALPVAAVCLVGGLPAASRAQRIVSFPSAAGYETISRDRALGRLPRREELLQALDFLESYERGIRDENDWGRDQDLESLEGLLPGQGALDVGDTNEIYPEDLDLEFRQETEGYPEYPLIEDNTAEIPAWLASYLLREAEVKQEDYPPQGEIEEEEEAQETQEEEEPWDLDEQELLEALLQEEEEEEEAEAEAEALEEALREEMERKEDEVIGELVEQEMEDTAVNDILDDIWAQEVLQEDAEENLKWLLTEEEDRLQWEEEEGDEEDDGEEEEDPFEFGFFSSEALGYPASEPDGQSAPESYGEEFGEYGPGSSSEDGGDFVGESLDEAEREELMEEAAEILDLEDLEDEDEERRKEIRARRILETVISSLAKEAVQEEIVQEEDEDDDEEEGEVEEDESTLTSSVLDAGMGDGGSEEDVQQEVYDELVEFLENEINRAIEDVADDILEAIDEEAKEAAGGVVEGEGEESTDEEGDGTQQGGEDVTSEESEDGDECSSLQYFIDDCNIVNNYEDLGADGYKERFAGACNRHQLCYACGEYYDVSSKLCDEIYKAEMLARCDADDLGCRQRAKYFWLVARNNRIPKLQSSPICADPCILNYMVEV